MSVLRSGVALKLWGAVLEALYANLLAYSVTRDAWLLDDYGKVREYVVAYDRPMVASARASPNCSTICR